jgi:hypothetical protein
MPKYIDIGMCIREEECRGRMGKCRSGHSSSGEQLYGLHHFMKKSSIKLILGTVRNP